MHKSRLKTKVTLDFAGRQIVEDQGSALHTEMGVIYDDAPAARDNPLACPDSEFEPRFIDRPRPANQPPSQFISTPKIESNKNKSTIRNQVNLRKVI